MLSFQIIDDETIQIFCDPKGIATLMEHLAMLLRNPDHVHLWGPSDGGNDLTETTPFGKPAVSEVIIDYHPEPYEPTKADG